MIKVYSVAVEICIYEERMLLLILFLQLENLEYFFQLSQTTIKTFNNFFNKPESKAILIEPRINHAESLSFLSLVGLIRNKNFQNFTDYKFSWYIKQYIAIMNQKDYIKFCQLEEGPKFYVKLLEEEIHLKVQINPSWKPSHIFYEAKITSLRNYEALSTKCKNMQQLYDLIKSSTKSKFKTQKKQLILIQGDNQPLISIPMQKYTVTKNTSFQDAQNLMEFVQNTNVQQRYFPQIIRKLSHNCYWLFHQVTQLKKQLEIKQKSTEPSSKRSKPFNSTEKVSQISNGKRLQKSELLSVNIRGSDQTGNSKSNPPLLRLPKKMSQLHPLYVPRFLQNNKSLQQDISIRQNLITNRAANGVTVFINNRHQQQQKLVFRFREIGQNVYVGLEIPQSKDRYMCGNKNLFFRNINGKQSYQHIYGVYERGQDVIMTVNLRNGLITWQVNNETLYFLSIDNLSQKKWVYVIHMQIEGDRVQLFQMVP